ncbi:MAG: DUF1513 domain-containing protein, partial [Noviherbaspirillum sp.]
DMRAHSGLSRRGFLLAGFGAMLLPELALATTPELRLLSPASRGSRHFATSLDGDGTHEASIPMRGHGLLVDPNRPGEALIIARRPGTLAVKIDLRRGILLRQWQSGEDRHFFGHACYSRDGRTLFVTANDIEAGQGLVSVRDADDFRVLAEYRTHGIGPHELLLMPDGVTLAVANGGIQTLPETGRVKLNRGRIDSSLVYLDSRDGRLLGKYVVPATQLSLRHLAVTPEGRLAAALQFEGDKSGPSVPLMMLHHGETELKFAEAPQAAWDRTRHYAASIEYDPASKRFALTCPHGDVIGCWTAAGEYAGLIEVPKVSGIAFCENQGFASNELGEIYRLDLANLDARLHAKFAGLQWDNHLYCAPPAAA